VLQERKLKKKNFCNFNRNIDLLGKPEILSPRYHREEDRSSIFLRRKIHTIWGEV